MVSVRGKTPIPMTPWGYSCHTRGNRQSELFKMAHVQMGNSILLMTWDTGGNLNSLVCHQQDFPQQQSSSSFVHLWSCIHQPKKGGIETILQISTKSLLCQLDYLLFGDWPHKPTVGISVTGHNQTCGQCLLVSPVFRFDHSSFVCVGGATNPCQWLSCESITLQQNKSWKCHWSATELLFLQGCAANSGMSWKRIPNSNKRGCHKDNLPLGDAGAQKN